MLSLFTVQAQRNADKNRGMAQDECAQLLTYPAEALSTAEVSALQFMREEEKLARDVYLRLQEAWQMPAFANIADAEQRHMDAMKCLLNKYELSDPVGTDQPGKFANAELGALYTQLVGEGLVSLEAAYRVGATIEDLDIVDLQKRMTEVDNADIRAAFTQVERGSRNHLRTFTRKLNSMNASYTPIHLTPEAYAAIISSPSERGGNGCNGNRSQAAGQKGGNCSGNCGGNCSQGSRGNSQGQGKGRSGDGCGSGGGGKGCGRHGQ
jgi:hypothetical protein